MSLSDHKNRTFQGKNSNPQMREQYGRYLGDGDMEENFCSQSQLNQKEDYKKGLEQKFFKKIIANYSKNYKL